MNSTIQFSVGRLLVDNGSPLRLTGSLNWTGTGEMIGEGIFRNEGLVTYATSSAQPIVGRFENAGEFRHVSAVPLELNSGAQFLNQAGGVYDIQTAIPTLFSRSIVGTFGVFENSGTLRKSSDGITGLSTIVRANLIGGTVEVLRGTLDWSTSANIFDGGNFLASLGAVIQVHSTTT